MIFVLLVYSELIQSYVPSQISFLNELILAYKKNVRSWLVVKSTEMAFSFVF